MMTIEVEYDETLNIFMDKGMQQTFKARVTNLLQEKLEAQDASDESNDMHESEHSDKVFDFLRKTSNNTCRNSATKIFKSFVN